MNVLKKLKNRINKTSGESFFLNQQYQLHNIARLQHLESLDFDFQGKKIIEFGAGIGDHTLYYLHKGGIVTPTDAREELIGIIQKRLGIKGLVLDVEKDIERIRNIQGYDFIHCYGLLYHINNPAQFIESIRNTGQVLLLETCVSPDHLPVNIHLLKEDKNDPTQAFSGTGCRPSRKWVELELKKHFKYVYYPKTQPEHPEFPVDWHNLNTGQLIRAIFIASHKELSNPGLVSEMPVLYEIKR